MAKYDVGYFYCAACGFVCSEEPYWLKEAYSSAISITDTGILRRNLELSSKLACALFFCLRAEGTFVDIAGGYGIMTRLMRDNGFNYFWEDKYCANLLAKGFEAPQNTRNVTAMSAFEVLEHTVDPVAFISEAMGRYDCRTIILSTETYIGEAPPRADWWYLSPASGQHVSFFHHRTLQHIADRLGVKFYSSCGLHIFTDRQLRHPWLLRLLRNSTSSLFMRFVRARLGSLSDSDHVILTRRIIGADKSP